MANRFYAGLIALGAVLFVLWNSIFIVDEREQAIVLRFGEIQRVVNAPGLYFKMPLGFAGADNVQKLPDRLLRFDLEDIRVQVSGGRFYVVDAFLVYNIADAALFRQQVSGSIPAAEQRLRTRLDAALRGVYGLRGFEAALSSERTEMMRQVRDQIIPDAQSLGIELTDVRIRRTDLTQEVSEQTYDRMRAERLAEAERLRARGQVAAREIRAAADREVVETVAAAQRDSAILRGEGDAEANAIFAGAYGRDPEFFDFYRSMNAYRQALENTGTTMVLSPDSEFFRYFNADTALDSAAAAGTPAPGAPAPADVPASAPDGDGEGAALAPAAPAPSATPAPAGAAAAVAPPEPAVPEGTAPAPSEPGGGTTAVAQDAPAAAGAPDALAQ